MCSLLLLSPAAERWIHTSPKPLCDTEIAVTWQRRNARLRTSARHSVCAPACHFMCLNRCICLPAVGERSAPFLQTLGGALAIELRLCVNQTASRAPRLPSAPTPSPPCEVPFFSCLMLSFRILFIFTSAPPEIPPLSSFILWETFIDWNLFFFFKQGLATQFRGQNYMYLKMLLFGKILNFSKTWGLA